MKLKLLGAILLSLICWAYPIKTLGQTAEHTKQNTKTEPVSYDYISEDIVIRNNAIISPKRIPTTPPKPVSKLRYSTEANGDIQLRMKAKVVTKWGEVEWPAMHYILDHESGSNPYAINPSSGACGIPQALPCSKLLNVIGSLDNIEGQLDWMVNYVAVRYDTPSKAMQFHQSHNWY